MVKELFQTFKIKIACNFMRFSYLTHTYLHALVGSSFRPWRKLNHGSTQVVRYVSTNLFKTPYYSVLLSLTYVWRPYLALFVKTCFYFILLWLIFIKRTSLLVDISDPANFLGVFQVSEQKDWVDLFSLLNLVNLVVLWRKRFLWFLKNRSFRNKIWSRKLTQLFSWLGNYIFHRWTCSRSKFLRV